MQGELALGVSDCQRAAGGKKDRCAGDGVALAVMDLAGESPERPELDRGNHRAGAGQGLPIGDEGGEAVFVDRNAVSRAGQERGGGLEGTLGTGEEWVGAESEFLGGGLRLIDSRGGCGARAANPDFDGGAGDWLAGVGADETDEAAGLAEFERYVLLGAGYGHGPRGD